MTVCECAPRVGGMFRLVPRTAEADPAMTLTGVFADVVGSPVETHQFTEGGGITPVLPDRRRGW